MGFTTTVSLLQRCLLFREDKHCGCVVANECEQSKDLSSEKEGIVRFVAKEATSVALTTKKIERQSQLDPELQNARYYIETSDWSKCKFMAYTCIKNELCTTGKLVLRDDRTVIPNTLRKRVLEVAHKGTSGNCQDKDSFKDKGVVAQDGQ